VSPPHAASNGGQRVVKWQTLDPPRRHRASPCPRRTLQIEKGTVGGGGIAQEGADFTRFLRGLTPSTRVSPLHAAVHKRRLCPVGDGLLGVGASSCRPLASRPQRLGIQTLREWETCESSVGESPRSHRRSAPPIRDRRVSAMGPHHRRQSPQFNASTRRCLMIGDNRRAMPPSHPCQTPLADQR
jgi:hypothetical protein